MYTKSQFYESSEVDKNSVVHISSVKFSISPKYWPQAGRVTLDYRIAVGYQINVDLGKFPEINKRSLLNKCSVGKN